MGGGGVIPLYTFEMYAKYYGVGAVGGVGGGRVPGTESRRPMIMDSDKYSLNSIAADPNFDFLNQVLIENDDHNDDTLFNTYHDSPYVNSVFQCSYVDPLQFASDYKNSKNISILTLNVQSLSAKFNDVYELIVILNKSNCAPDVLCLQELWQFPSNVDFSLPGYSNLTYKLRGNGVQGGGWEPI